MTPSDVFGIIVRFTGLSLLIYSCWYLTYGVAIGFDVIDRGHGSAAPYFLSGGLFLVISLYLVRGAPRLIRYSYPDKPSA